jgi:AraC-like DNA-binding protein
MYEYKGLQDIFFVMLYGGATLLAMVVCLYLLLARGNMFSSAINPPKTLRRWTAAFMASVAASHVWWVMLGMYWLTDDRLTRNIVAITLDRLTFVPLMMVVLLKMLQDRPRPLWPIPVLMIPIAVIAIYLGIIERNPIYEEFIRIYLLITATAFIIYMIYAVKQYGKWLQDNYADLEHKEVWQSMILLIIILLMFYCYKTNFGGFISEYLVQLNTIVLIAFLTWRVETLQQLDEEQVEEAEEENFEELTTGSESASRLPNHIGPLLKKHCEDSLLYLQKDLTLMRLSTEIGTNRTYLSAYFQQQGITYNAYINRLRIEHFMQIYRDSIDTNKPFSVQEKATESGFQSYRTFAIAFKNFIGMTAREWMEKET